MNLILELSAFSVFVFKAFSQTSHIDFKLASFGIESGLKLSDLSLEDRFGLIFKGHSELLKFIVLGSFKGFELSFPSLNLRFQSGGLSFEF